MLLGIRHKKSLNKWISTGIVATSLLFIWTIMPFAWGTEDSLSRSRGNTEALRILFHDTPGAPFAGFIMAYELGYYKEADLPPVELIWRNQTTRLFEELKHGRVDLITSWMGEGMVQAARGDSIIAIHLTTKRSSACFNYRTDLYNTRELKDLNGKNVALWFRYEETARAFLALNGIKATVVLQRPESGLLFSMGVIDALFSTSYMEIYCSRYLKFHDAVRSFRFRDYHANFPEDTIFCRPDYLEKHPERCRRFLEATCRGWRFVVDNPEKTAITLVAYAKKMNVLGDPIIVREQLTEWSKTLSFNYNLENNGDCDPNRYESLSKALQLSRTELQGKMPQFDTFFIHLLGKGSLTHFSKPKKQQEDPKGNRGKTP